MTPRMEEIRREQSAQRGLIRSFIGIYLGCFIVGWYIAAAVQMLSDRSAQW